MTLSFMHFAFVRVKVFKKKRLINRVSFFSKRTGAYLCVCVQRFCVLLNVIMFVYVLLLARTHIRLFEYILTCIFTYVHILPLSIVGMGWDQGKEFEKRRVAGERVRKWIDAIRMIFPPSIILINFMVAKGLFDLNMKCLFSGEFCKWWWWLNIKSSSRYLHTHIYIYI